MLEQCIYEWFWRSAIPNASDAYYTHRARIFDDWDVSVVDSRDLVRLKKGYEIEVTEKLYSNEVLKVKLSMEDIRANFTMRSRRLNQKYY